MFVLFSKDLAENSFAARQWLFKNLSPKKLHRKVGFRCLDSGCIGGRWSGILTTDALDQERLIQFLKEVEQKHHFKVLRADVDTFLKKPIAVRQKEIATKIFLNYFPDFKGEVPFYRDEFQNLGYEDDAIIPTTERMYYKYLANYEGKVWEGSPVNGLSCIDLDDEVISPDHVIGKKWLVILDCHI